jgi:hypothetical protein
MASAFIKDIADSLLEEVSLEAFITRPINTKALAGTFLADIGNLKDFFGNFLDIRVLLFSTHLYR